MRTVWASILVASLSPGCKKKPAEGVENATGAPASTKEIDALWALAPEGTTVAIVASPRAVQMAEHAWLDVRKLLATAPELAPFNAMLGDELQQMFGKPDLVLADLGLSPTKGGGFFVTPGGGGIAIIPVGDRDKFLAAAHGTKGTDSDTVGKATCKMQGGDYICASSPEVFGKIGKGSLKGKLDAVSARGEIELVASVPLPGGITGGAAVVQLARGAVTVRAAVTGVPPAMLASFSGARVRPRAEAGKTAGFGVVNLAPMLKSLPAIPIGGVTLAEVGRSIEGPLTMHIAPASKGIDVRVPVKDPAPVSALVAHCTEIPGLAASGATVQDGACHVMIPSLGIPVDVWVEGKELRLGTRGATPPSVVVPMTPLGTELAGEEAVFGFWGRGTLFGQALGTMPALPAIPDAALVGVRALGMLSEMGGSVQIEGDKVEIVLGLRTLWSNPDDVVAKLVAISPQTFIDGKAGDAAKAIAEGAPGSPFAADYQAGTSGLMAPMAVVGMVSAVAIPAFMDYMKRGKTTEASLMLLRLAKSAKAEYATSSSLPVGDGPLTPAEPCCQGPGAKCPPAGAAWQQGLWPKLDFAIDEPTRFQYRVHSDGKTLDAEAIGDLDCDGITVTYKLHAVDAGGRLDVTFEEPPRGAD